MIITMYDHVRCKCGGIIGMYNRDTFNCGECNTEYLLYKLDYDVCWTNPKTGWIFPMKFKEAKL